MFCRFTFLMIVMMLWKRHRQNFCQFSWPRSNLQILEAPEWLFDLMFVLTDSCFCPSYILNVWVAKEDTDCSTLMTLLRILFFGRIGSTKLVLPKSIFLIETIEYLTSYTLRSNARGCKEKEWKFIHDSLNHVQNDWHVINNNNAWCNQFGHD